MLIDLIDEFISRARQEVDRHPVGYADVEHEIAATIRVLENLQRLIELGRQRPTLRDIVEAQRCRRRIEVAPVLSLRGR